MSDLVEFAELFDVNVDQLARTLALVAPQWFGRFQRAEPVEAQTPENATDGGRRDLQFGRDLLAAVALPAQSLDGGACGSRRLAWR